jgi:hypothetical protein
MTAANYTIYTCHSAFAAPHCVMGTPDVRHQRIITLIFNEGMGHFPILFVQKGKYCTAMGTLNLRLLQSQQKQDTEKVTRYRLN